MATLSKDEIDELLTPYLPGTSPLLLAKLSLYLDLLLKWNAKTNLTAIRDPKEIVRRHFGESLFAGLHIALEADSLLDFGSGAGFPGIPIALTRPEIRITLAESQNKKATFLREVVRTLGISIEVWPARAETMPETRQFHTVTLRAVDNMADALKAAEPRVQHQIVLLASGAPTIDPFFRFEAPIPIPNTQTGILLRAIRL